jgi:hypothetical protein
MDLIFHLNSMPRTCGTDSAKHAMSRLEGGYVIEKFKPLFMDCFFNVRENMF